LVFHPQWEGAMAPYTAGESELSEGPQPRGELAARTLAMPGDANPAGDIFGGWIMSLMDNAGAMTATRYTGCRVVTAAATRMSFLQPVKVGDTVCCYTELASIGRTSVTLWVEVWVLRQGRGIRQKVTAAEFTFVALDGDGRPCPIDRTKLPQDELLAQPAHHKGKC
jgi:acyl-CoA thioesterase YciA